LEKYLQSLFKGLSYAEVELWTIGEDMTEKRKPTKIIPAGEQSENLPVVTSPIQLLQVAIQKDVDVDKLKQLIELEKDYRAEQARAEFNQCFSKFSTLKEVIPHNAEGRNGGATYTYTKYPALVKAISPWLEISGLSFSHKQSKPVEENGSVKSMTVTCIIRAPSGHAEETSFPAFPDDKLRDKQSAGVLLQAAVAYAQRQTLLASLGLATEFIKPIPEDNKQKQGYSKPWKQNNNQGYNSNNRHETVEKKQEPVTGMATEGMINTIRRAMENMGLDEAMFMKEEFNGIELDDIQQADVNPALEKIERD